MENPTNFSTQSRDQVIGNVSAEEAQENVLGAMKSVEAKRLKERQSLLGLSKVCCHVRGRGERMRLNLFYGANGNDPRGAPFLCSHNPL